ncbi:MAG: ribosome silencing factor [Candidatus Krumholzibacteria bacterium]|nr:ribosome silencing factor [Candidatus Krumholzibacteria bacterium]
MDQRTDQEESNKSGEAGVEPNSLPDDSAGYALTERAAWHLLEKRAEDLVVLDLRGRSDVCDFFLIASGNSKTQVQALAKHMHKSLLGAGHRPKGLEGMDSGRWALLDFFDVVVHIFQTDVREYFQLEKLWGDAPRLDLDSAWFALPETAGRHPDLNFTTTSGADRAD